MEKYDYSYQDWIAGKIEPEELLGLKINKRICHKEFVRIRLEQIQAYRQHLSNALENMIDRFQEGYKLAFLKNRYIERAINYNEEKIEEIKTESKDVIKDALGWNTDRLKLTAKQIEAYLSGKVNMEEELRERLKIHSPFTFLLLISYREWLLWFKEQKALEKIEPTIYVPNYSARYLEETAVNKSKTNSSILAWPQLFKNPAEANKILALLSEYLSDTGQWLENGRTLVALYAELKQKGYLKQNLSGEKVANAFNKQFGTSFVSRNFQPADVSRAESYRDRFSYIPSYAPDNSIA